MMPNDLKEAMIILLDYIGKNKSIYAVINFAPYGNYISIYPYTEDDDCDSDLEDYDNE